MWIGSGQNWHYLDWLALLLDMLLLGDFLGQGAQFVLHLPEHCLVGVPLLRVLLLHGIESHIQLILCRFDLDKLFLQGCVLGFQLARLFFALEKWGGRSCLSTLNFHWLWVDLVLLTFAVLLFRHASLEKVTS